MCNLEVMKTAKNSYLWSCIDFSEDISKPSLEKFGIRFKTEEEFDNFKKIWENALEENKKLDWGQNKTDENKKEENTDEKKTEEKQTQDTKTAEQEA